MITKAQLESEIMDAERLLAMYRDEIADQSLPSFQGKKDMTLDALEWGQLNELWCLLRLYDTYFNKSIPETTKLKRQITKLTKIVNRNPYSNNHWDLMLQIGELKDKLKSKSL